MWHHWRVRWLSLIVLASFLGSATIADAQVFKQRGKGGAKSGKATTTKKPATAAAKKPATSKRSTKPASTAKTTKSSKGSKSKVAASRPSDLTPDPVDADTDYVVIEDTDD